MARLTKARLAVSLIFLFSNSKCEWRPTIVREELQVGWKRALVESGICVWEERCWTCCATGPNWKTQRVKDVRHCDSISTSRFERRSTFSRETCEFDLTACSRLKHCSI